MARAEARVYVVGDAKGFHTTMRRATWDAMTFQQKMMAIGGQLKSVGRTMTYGVTLPIVAGLTLATKAAVDEEKEMALLAKALKNTTGATDEQVAAVEKWITATQNATGVADGELRPALASLLTATRDTAKAQDLMGVALDIAAAKGKPVGKVAEALMKAYNGNMGSLGRLGIKIKDATGETMTFEQAMKQAQATFGGSAAKAADTAAGRFAIMSNKLRDMGEAIGTTLIPVLDSLVGVVTPVINVFANMGETQRKLLIGAGLLAAALGPLMSVMGTLMQSVKMLTTAYNFLFVAKMKDGIVTKAGAAQMAILQVRMLAAAVATKVVAAAQWLWNAAMSANPIGLVIAAIAALVAIFVVLYKKNQTFRSVVNAVWGAVKAVVSAVIGVIIGLIKRWWAAMQTNIGIMRALWHAAVAAFGGIKSAIGAVVNAIQWLWGKFSWLRGLIAGLHIPNPFSALLAAIRSIISAAQTAYGWLKKLGSQKGPGVGVHYGQGRALGGPIDGPRSGYPIIAHGRETVVAHNNPSRGLADLFGSGILALGGGGATEVHVYIDGREMTSQVMQRFAIAKRRTGRGRS